MKIIEWKLIQGNEKISKEPLKLLFSGSQTDFAYIKKLVYKDKCDVVMNGKMPASLFLFIARRNYYNCDLLFFQYKRNSCIDVKSSEYCVPLWVGSTVSLPLVAKNNSSKSDIRLIRKNNLEYRIVDFSESVDDFYYNYWIPTIKIRYPEKNVYRERDTWNKYRCELLVVSDGTSDIAGALIRYDENHPYLWRNGLRYGNMSFCCKGAMAATYYFVSEYLYLKGYKSLYLGLSRAFLSDGVFQYKRKWGGVLKSVNNYAYILRVYCDSRGVKSFLINNSFISIYKGEFVSTLFYDCCNNYNRDDYLYGGVGGVRFIDINNKML
ncbi:hypothetical protein [Chlorobium limicola]